MTSTMIESKSIELLNEFGLFKAPVNVVKLAEKIGITIEEQDLDDGVSGFLVRKDGADIIGVNKYHPEVRKRFTISHEIGHFKLHVEVPLFVDYYKGSKLNRKNAGGNYRLEKQANTFAACLLMPKRLILDELAKLDEELEYELKLYSLSKKFIVSKEAMDYRLKALGLYDYGF
ncbi:ImmA/IrrE family metallo-endopeptidase [Flagellimonas myxillae]|uniref:ImmA/IrrE family metallo-endopeptidase n=1 Tax=Flagellimonas myxillae TaxID=2942214 RepID=UPI00201F4499|nr:ImmA/IrrE family metallo-endopeptidase [Muricauda myxillae]MCL6266588.1 ImmA/IrrE family metallo-endopeptidase [Muricauda myxillae]